MVDINSEMRENEIGAPPVQSVTKFNFLYMHGVSEKFCMTAKKRNILRKTQK